MSMSTPIVKTRDGLTLLRRSWPAAHAKGTVVLVHGIAEHSGRYRHVAAHLNGWGWNVEAYDQRGHGHSEGEQGALCRDDDLVEDLATVLADVRHEQPDGPLLVLGHSMGGLVTGCYAADLLTPSLAARRTDVDAIVMVSPALDVSTSIPLAGRLAMATVGRALPDLRVRTGFDPRTVCNDPLVVQAYRDDPLVHDLISARLGRFIVEGGQRVRRLAPRWRLPTLLLYAGADRIVSPQGCELFAHAAPSCVRSWCFAHMAHEILNEPDQIEVFRALGEGLAWLGPQMAVARRLQALADKADAA